MQNAEAALQYLGGRVVFGSMPNDPEYVVSKGTVKIVDIIDRIKKDWKSLGCDRRISVVWGAGVQLDEVCGVLFEKLLEQFRHALGA
jgi:hypothetical protein